MRSYGQTGAAGPTNAHTPPPLPGAHLGPVPRDTTPMPTTVMSGNKTPARKWTPEQIAEVKAVWLDTGSYQQTAEQLGWLTTKQAADIRRHHYPMLERRKKRTT